MPLKNSGNVWSKTYNIEQNTSKNNQEKESSEQTVSSGGQTWPGALESKQTQEGNRFNNENKNKQLFSFEIEGTSSQSKPMMTLGMESKDYSWNSSLTKQSREDMSSFGSSSKLNSGDASSRLDWGFMVDSVFKEKRRNPKQ